MKAKVDKRYVSEADQLLDELRKKFPESDSQAQERKKYARIGTLRDQMSDSESSPIWDGF